MNTTIKSVRLLATCTTLALVLSACAKQPASSVDYRGTRPTGQLAIPSQLPSTVTDTGLQVTPQPVIQPIDKRIVSMSGYEAVIAQEGETLGDISSITGVDVTQLSQKNGLNATTRLRAGDQVILPDNWRISQGTSVPAGIIQSTPLNENTLPAVAQGPRNQAQDIINLQPPSSIIEPVQQTIPQRARSQQPSSAPYKDSGVAHTVLSGDTVFSISRAYGVSVSDIAAYNNLSSDYEIVTGQQLRIPAGGQRVPRKTANASQAQIQPQANTLSVPVPPSASKPLPKEPKKAPKLESPKLAEQKRTLPASSVGARGQFLQPVKGNIVKSYKKNGSGSEGINFSAKDNAPIVAAQDGEIALISKSVGGLGTVVLIQHNDNWNTVYGRVNDVKVQKGQTVKKGQVIGRVAPADVTQDATLHFEIRKGTQSVDPAPLL